MWQFRSFCFCSIFLMLFICCENHSVFAGNSKASPNLEKIMSHINGKKFALVIGIDKYPTMPLEAAVNDAKAVSKRLTELNFKVTSLIDAEATLKNIRHVLGSTFSRTQPNDQIVIYFAGHGITENLHSNKVEGYILPINTNLKDLYASAISMNELRDLTARIPAKHILFAFDSCYSGLGLTRAIKVVPPMQDIQQHIESMAGKRAAYMITAGKADEVAREYSGHGLFTLHFLDGIAGAADTAPKDNIVQATELGQYLATMVAKETKNEQNPQHGLIEGDGDFLFPLMDDDPVRLRQSTLGRLAEQSSDLLNRKNMQDEYNLQIKLIKQAEKVYRDDFDRKVSELDNQISQKQAEIKQLSKNIVDSGKAGTIREQYNVMKFLNTGIKIDILKVFPTLNAAESYFSNAWGYTGRKALKLQSYDRWIPNGVKNKLSKENTYSTKTNSYTSDYKNNHWLRKPLSRGFKVKEYSYTLSQGYISHTEIKTITPSLIVSMLNRIHTPLAQDNTTYIAEIYYSIGGITSNDKLLLFDQFTDRMIARYGQPTKYGKDIRVSNWKTGSNSKYREMIWEDNNVSLMVTGRRSTIKVYIKNKNKIIKEIYKQAINLCEAEQLILLKERIQKMADLERQKTLNAKNLEF